MAVVRLKPDYTVSEDDTDVTVCAVVETSSGPADCPVGFEFSVSLSTVDQTAGTLLPSSNVKIFSLTLSVQKIIRILMWWLLYIQLDLVK